jgi:hypothetical protein
MKVLPNFYNLREPNNFHGWGDEETLLKVYSEERVGRASSGLANNLSKATNLSSKESKKFSQELFKAYLDKQHKKRKKILSYLGFRRLLITLRHRLKLRTRVTDIINRKFYQGSHPLIYPKYLMDFLKAKEVVLKFNLSSEELNKARTKIEYL